jgi:hypothetical protein
MLIPVTQTSVVLTCCILNLTCLTRLFEKDKMKKKSDRLEWMDEKPSQHTMRSDEPSPDFALKGSSLVDSEE